MKKLHFIKRHYPIILVMIAISWMASCSQPTNTNEKKASTENVAVVSEELKSLNKKILENDNNDALYIERAKYYLDNQLADSAIRDILFAIDINKHEPSHFVLLSDAYLVLGNPDKCRESIDKALAIDPTNKQALLKLGMLYLYMKNYDDSFKTIGKLLQIDQINPEAYFIRGYGLMEKGDTSASITDFKAAADQDQKYYDAYLQLGMIYSAKHNPLAVDYLNTAIKIRPGIIQPYYQLALFYQENDQIEKAVSSYQTILDKEHDFIYALYNLGYINLVYLKDFSKATEYFTKVVGIDPTYAEAWYNRGWSYELMGNDDLARKDYNKTLEIKSNFRLAIDGLNRLDNKTGNQN